MLQVMCLLQRTSEMLQAPEGLTAQLGRLSCCTTLKENDDTELLMAHVLVCLTKKRRGLCECECCVYTRREGRGKAR